MRIITLACSLAALIVASPLSAQTLNVASAGDQNMVDYVKDYLGPISTWSSSTRRPPARWSRKGC
jgi:hypothetical protein